MLRLLAAFVLLFAGAAACLLLLPSPPKVAQAPSAMADPPSTEAAVPRPGVRVVYPGPGVTAAPVAAASASASNDPVPMPAPAPAPAPAQAATLYPQVQPATTADATAATVPSNPAVQAGSTGVNLNTASIDALNQIPGAGRIGRTIASHRPYRSVEDLLTKRVVKRSVYDRIKAQVAAE